METMGQRVRYARELRGKTQKELAAACTVSQQAIQMLEEGEIAKPRYLDELCDFLSVSKQWIKTGIGEIPKEKISSEVLPASHTNPYPLNINDRIPVYAAANAALPGVIRYAEDHKVGTIERHPELRYVKDGFGVEVYGDSMVPRLSNGEIVYVHPRKEPIPDRECVVILQPGDEVLVKRFVKKTDKELVLRQFNPAEEIRIPLSKVKQVLAVVGIG